MLNRVPLSPYHTIGVQPVSHGTMGAQPSYLLSQFLKRNQITVNLVVLLTTQITNSQFIPLTTSIIQLQKTP